MPRKPVKSRKIPRPVLYDSLRFYLETGIYATGDKFPDCPARAETFILAGSPREKQFAIWELNREVILRDWIRENPCSRPFFWWNFEAPEIRRRIGGVGDLWHDIESYEPHECFFGIPFNFVTAWEVDYYNGRSKDIYGKIIPSSFKEGDLKKIPVDPNDSPVFESQAAFLDRHNLLTPAEKRHLENHPELMEPEQLEFEDDEDD